MINREIYDIIDDNCGEGYENQSEAFKEMYECYKGVAELTVEQEGERWYIIRKK